MRFKFTHDDELAFISGGSSGCPDLALHRAMIDYAEKMRAAHIERRKEIIARWLTEHGPEGPAAPSRAR